MGAGSLDKRFRGKGGSIQKSIRNPLAIDILRNNTRNKVYASTVECWIGLEGRKLYKMRMRVWKLRGWLQAWMDMKGNSKPPRGFDERGDTVRAAGEENEFGSCMKH